jgi:hypothetical protein
VINAIGDFVEPECVSGMGGAGRLPLSLDAGDSQRNQQRDARDCRQ